MSHSPAAEVADIDESYFDGWQDLAVRIQQGQSFSGRERNCCFLNTRGERFADVSATIGLDQIDDGRAVAVVDWDHDGDLDLLVANRTGPRIRFLENRFNTSPNSISLRLVGDLTQRCNRDAIGARAQIAIELPDGKESVLTRTVYAGDAFVSQSSKWLHFGIPDEARIRATAVRWPGSQNWMQIEGIREPGRFVVRQSTEQAERQVAREPIELQSKENLLAENEPTIRVALPQPQNVLPLDYHDLSVANKVRKLERSARVRLIVMWAPWCAPCLAELADFNAHASQLTDANIEIVALSVDSVSESVESARQAALAYQKGAELPFALGLADETSLRRLTDAWQKAMYRKRQLPIPTSFLIDPQGRLRIVYNGRVSVEQLVADAAGLFVPDDQIPYAAVPMKGRWADPLFVTNPIAIASIYREELQFEDGDEYLLRYQNENPLPPKSDVSEDAERARRRHADICYHRGKIAMDQKLYQKAVDFFQQALSNDARMVVAMADSSTCLQRLGKTNEAIRLLHNALRLVPHNADGWNQLGVMYLSVRHNENAAKCFERALKIDSRAFSAANNLAWLRATAREQKLRNGQQAVLLARQLANGPGANRADVFDTLAAAYAENGEFALAEKHGLRAMELAKQKGQAEMAARIQKRVLLYRQSQPFRDP